MTCWTIVRGAAAFGSVAFLFGLILHGLWTCYREPR